MKSLLAAAAGAALLLPTATAGAAPVFAADRYDAGHRLCRFADARIDESSGLASSSLSDTLVWTHNDSGDTNRFFGVDTRTCATVATYAASTPSVGAEGEYATAFDIENMARGRGVDGKPALFLADIGDNYQAMATHTVYEYAEPDGTVPAGSTPTTEQPLPVTMHRITFPGTTPMDEETVAVTPDRHLVIVTKPRGAAPGYAYTGKSQVFVSSAAMAGTDALTMTKVADVDFTVLTGGAAGSYDIAATGGDITQDGRRIAVRTYTLGFEWLVPTGDAATALAQAFATAPTKINLLPTKQGEALAYSRDQTSLLTSSEGSGTAADVPPGGVVDRYDALGTPGGTPAASLPDGRALGLAAAAGVALAGTAVARHRRT